MNGKSILKPQLYHYFMSNSLIFIDFIKIRLFYSIYFFKLIKMNTFRMFKLSSKDELKALKIVYLLIKRGVKPITNQNGEFSFRRHDFTQSIDVFILSKNLKLLNIRHREQLNNLFNIHNNDMFNINIPSYESIVAAEQSNYINYKQLSSKSSNPKHSSKHTQFTRIRINEMELLTIRIFNRYRENRIASILFYGITTFKLNHDTFIKCGFDNPQDYNITDFGYVDYYNGIILLANLNINQIMTLPNNSVVRSNEHGYLPSKESVNLENGNKIDYHSIFDLRHPNTSFKLWICGNNPNIRRLYFPNPNGKGSSYLTLNRKYALKPIESNHIFTYGTLSGHPVKTYNFY